MPSKGPDGMSSWWQVYYRDGVMGPARRLTAFAREHEARASCRWANRHVAPSTPGRLYWTERRRTDHVIDPEMGMEEEEEGGTCDG
jgi:hypothetical protein